MAEAGGEGARQRLAWLLARLTERVPWLARLAARLRWPGIAGGRRLVQAAFLVAFVVLFVRMRYPFHPSPAPDLLLRTSPLAPLFFGAADRAVPWAWWPGLVVLALTPLLGRFFCSWVCPLGAMLDLAGERLAPAAPERQGAQARSWPAVKFLVLAAVVAASAAGLHAWFFFDPLAIANRGMTVVLFPLGTWIAQGAAELLERLPGAGGLGGALRRWLRGQVMPEGQTEPAFFWFTALFFLGLLATEWVTRRFWCRTLCPAGALLALCSRFRGVRRQVDSSCVQCRQCSRRCPMGAIPADDVTATARGECTLCLDCLDHCPVGLRAIGFVPGWAPWPEGMPVPTGPLGFAAVTPLDLTRRRLLQAAAGGLLAAGGARVALDDPRASTQLIRPPGALPEPAFLERCIRCLACVRVCSSNGGCLEPAGFEAGFPRLWTPRAHMKTGYCEYNCNLCGQVCPTGAIKRLPEAEKQKTVMGQAVFNKNHCIPYAKLTDCLVCEEHCPLPEKAIQTHEREVDLPDGTRRKVKFPYVVPERCIGCGICEHKCPLPGTATGVFVVRAYEKR